MCASLGDDDAHAVHFTVRVNALEVVDLSPIAAADDPPVHHHGLAIRAGSIDVRLLSRCVGNIALDLDPTTNRLIEVSGTVMYQVLVHLASIITEKHKKC